MKILMKKKKKKKRKLCKSDQKRNQTIRENLDNKAK